MTEHRRLSAPTGPHPYRFNQNDYLLLDRSGAFEDYTKTELIGGTIFAMNAQFSAHARVHSLLYQALTKACAKSRSGLSAWIEVTVALSERDLPQPDIILTPDLPVDGPVPAAGVALVIEIADTSLMFDLDAKLATYAAAGIAEYWVADVNGRLLHQAWWPAGGRYANTRQTQFGEILVAATIADLSVDTATL